MDKEIKRRFEEIKDYFVHFKPDKAHIKPLAWILIELALIGGIIAFDLCMKDYLVKFLSNKPHMSYTVIDGFFDLYYSENTGAGFGMFKDGTLALTIVTAIVIVACLLYLAVFHHDSEWLRIPLVMISAGGIGNLVDRIQLGYVRDFFEFTFVDFAIFNVADAFVTVGSIWLIIYLIVSVFVEDKKKKQGKAKNDEGEEYYLFGTKEDYEAQNVAENAETVLDAEESSNDINVDGEENLNDEEIPDAENANSEENNVESVEFTVQPIEKEEE